MKFSELLIEAKMETNHWLVKVQPDKKDAEPYFTIKQFRDSASEEEVKKDLKSTYAKHGGSLVGVKKITPEQAKRKKEGQDTLKQIYGG